MTARKNTTELRQLLDTMKARHDSKAAELAHAEAQMKTNAVNAVLSGESGKDARAVAVLREDVAVHAAAVADVETQLQASIARDLRDIERAKVAKMVAEIERRRAAGRKFHNFMLEAGKAACEMVDAQTAIQRIGLKLPRIIGQMPGWQIDPLAYRALVAANHAAGFRVFDASDTFGRMSSISEELRNVHQLLLAEHADLLPAPAVEKEAA